MTLTEYLRLLVNTANERGTTRYAIGKAAKIDQAALKRFAEGGGIDGKTIDKLWQHFDLPLPRKPRKRRAKDA